MEVKEANGNNVSLHRLELTIIQNTEAINGTTDLDSFLSTDLLNV